MAKQKTEPKPAVPTATLPFDRKELQQIQQEQRIRLANKIRDVMDADDSSLIDTILTLICIIGNYVAQRVVSQEYVISTMLGNIEACNQLERSHRDNVEHDATDA